MNSSPIKVITFDLDDTLWDIEPVLIHAEQTVFNWLQQQAPNINQHFTLQNFNEWRWQYYKTRPDLSHQISDLRIAAFEQALQLCGYGAAESADLAKQAFALFIEARHQVTPFETAIPMLDALYGRYRLGVLTNGNANVFKLPLGRYFDFAISAEQLNSSKPAADHFRAAQLQGQAKAQQIIHIGDHLKHDILGANLAGFHSIWFNPDNQVAEGIINPSQQVQCLSNIPTAITAIEQSLVHNLGD